MGLFGHIWAQFASKFGPWATKIREEAEEEEEEADDKVSLPIGSLWVS